MSNSKKLRTFVQYAVFFNGSSSLPKIDETFPVLFDSFDDALSYLREIHEDSRIFLCNFVIRRLEICKYYGD